jgi:hypothetical protein
MTRRERGGGGNKKEKDGGGVGGGEKVSKGKRPSGCFLYIRQVPAGAPLCRCASGIIYFSSRTKSCKNS